MAILESLFALTSVAGLVVPEVKEAIRKPKLRKINKEIKNLQSQKLGDYNSHRNIQSHDQRIDAKIEANERMKDYV